MPITSVNEKRVEERKKMVAVSTKTLETIW
jgi:hypothetical protein